jgi:cation transport ATPase
MASKSTSITQLQQVDETGNSHGAVEDVLNELQQHEQQQLQFQQQQQQQQQQPEVYYDNSHQQQQQQQHQQHHQHSQQQPPVIYPPVMPSDLAFAPPSKPLSLVERIMNELKDALVVLVVFIALNFEPVSNGINNLIGKVSTNSFVILGVKGVLAAVVFYAIRKLVFQGK